LDWDLAITALQFVPAIVSGGFGDTNIHKRGHHLFVDLRVGWPELSDTPHANRFILRIK
jgi:hypothetical protein